jgi:hypothetical protein
MSSATRVVIVPHTHWDREWYEPEARFRQRLVELLDDVISRLESDGSGRFLLDGQTVLLEDYLLVRPEQAARVGALVRSGQLVVGPWYVLADEQLTSDETLVRNLLAGRADGRRHGGWMPVGYSPDAFGHPAALPTILAGFGIEHAMVLRGYGGEAGQERDLFNWVGADGSVVLTYHFPPAGFEVAANLPEDRAALAQRWEQMREMLEARATLPLLLAMNGADHHSLQPGIGRITAWLNDLAPGYDFALGTPGCSRARCPRAPASSRRLPSAMGCCCAGRSRRLPWRWWKGGRIARRCWPARGASTCRARSTTPSAARRATRWHGMRRRVRSAW